MTEARISLESLPALEGSDKQVAFAADKRAQVVADINELIERRTAEVPVLQRRCKTDADRALMGRLPELLMEAAMEICQETSARRWIDGIPGSTALAVNEKAMQRLRALRG